MAARPDVIDAVVDRELNVERVAAWLNAKAGRIEPLREIGGLGDVHRPAAEIPDVAEALRTIEALDKEIVDVIAARLIFHHS